MTEANESNSKRYLAGMWIRPLELREMLKCNGISEEAKGKEAVRGYLYFGVSMTKLSSGSSEQVSFPQLSL